MNLWRRSGISSRGRLTVALLALTLLLAPAPAPAQDVAPDRPEQQQAFEALNQWMRQNAAAFSLNLPGMQDPFRPFKPTVYTEEEERERALERCRRSPFCHWHPRQLKLVAITVPDNRSGSPLAAFEDGAGESYILRKGDPIGRDNGRIVKITESTVTVEELPCGALKPVITVIELTQARPLRRKPNNDRQ
ncbi:MAG: pilus assembly protein PilP [Candidatus Adiutrix sp.]|jgi:Tfp pilus assembly protein PilP|nr:pilus assembly protein PilP [Candidatus Adiutrix sp.]